jgi:nucleotide-binding universal stress UspA family protein
MTTPPIFLTTDAHLLVPVDFSNHSRTALHAAADMIRKTGVGRLTLLSIVEPPTSGMRIQTADLHQSMEEETARTLHEWAKVEIPDIETSQIAAVCGVPGDEICEQAAKRGVNLIVIATHGHTGLKHYLLGSVAEKVVRNAKCPVLVVR